MVRYQNNDNLIITETNAEEVALSDIIDLKNLIKLNDFLILHVNIRGLRTNLNFLEIFIENLIKKPDIIVCSETGRLPCYKYYNLNNYVSYYNHGSLNKSDGCIVYIKNTIVESTCIESIDNFKYINSIIKLNNNISIKVTSLYRCHKIKKSDFCSYIQHIIQNEKNTSNHLIVGDFNMNIMDTSNCLNGDYLNNYLIADYKPLFTKITRPNDTNPNSGSCIDNMFLKCNNANKNKLLEHKAIIIKQIFPDHYPILTSFNLKVINKEKTNNNTYMNKRTLINYCSKANWNSILALQDPGDAINAFICLKLLKN